MITILLADDEAIERRYFRNLFHRHPEYQVVGEAQNGGIELAGAQCAKEILFEFLDVADALNLKSFA